MEIVLKLYTYVNGVNDTPFPNAEEQAMFTFTYDANRMGGSPQISATVKHRLCLDDLWTNNVYAEFRGEKYFIMNTPSSSKDNEDERYTHDIELLSEREVLNHVYFIDAVQGNSEIDNVKSNSSKVQFMGNINEFVSRLNASLSYAKLDYTAVIDDGITSEDKLVSFEDKYILEALQEIFNIYELPYYFVGKTIHIGYTENVITTVFRYGYKDALLSINKENANYKIVNRCTGAGSSDNIPYYYPNKTAKGDVSIIFGGENQSLSEGDIIIKDINKFASKFLSTDKCVNSLVIDSTNISISRIRKELSEGRFTDYTNGSSISTKCLIDKNSKYYYSINFILDVEIKGDTYVKLDINGDLGTITSTPVSNTFSPSLTAKIKKSSEGDSSYVALEDDQLVKESGTYNIYVTLTCTNFTLIAIPNEYPVISVSPSFSVENSKIASWVLDSSPNVKVNLSDFGLELKTGVTPAIGDNFTQKIGDLIPVSETLMPPVYRESGGAERFYNAENNKYEIPDSEGYYVFENEYSSHRPEEMIVDFSDIKPTIKEMTNGSGQRIDMFTEFAYDLNDNDEYDEEKNEYVHPYFFAKLRKFNGEYGFNLFDHASESDTMKVSFTSGVCGACTFEIGVGEETNKNIVQVDDNGNLKRDEEGNVLWENQSPQDRQNDTQNYEVWIALKKDDSTYTNIMPNVNKNLKPSVDDTFVLLGINLPDSYIYNAENKLKEAIIKYMYENNKEKFNFSIKFSRIFFAEHPEILEQLNENSRLTIEYNGQEHTLYVDSFTYKTEESASLPEIEVTLADTLSVGKNSLENALDSVKQEIYTSFGNIDFLKQGLKYFLRKDVDDSAKGIISFLRGFKIGNKYISTLSSSTDVIKEKDNEILSSLKSINTFLRKDKEDSAKFLINFLGGAYFGAFLSGENGAKIDSNGIAELASLFVRGQITGEGITSKNFLSGVLGQGFTLKKKEDGKSYLEVDELFVRIKALFTELEIKKLSYAGGNFIFSPAGIVLSQVEETETGYKCYFTNDDGTAATENLFRVDDLCLCQTFNIKAGVHQNVKNKRYWRACIEVGDNYFVLSKTDCEANSDIPEKGDSVVVLGNKTDAERQNAIIISVYGEGSPSFTQHNGINTYSLVGTEKTRISPTLNNFTGEFHFSSGESVEEITTGLNQKVNDAIKTLTEQAGFITAIQDDLEAVKNQADGAIESWFYDPAPTLDNEPAVNWTDDATKKVHLGDLYYDGSGKSYRFQIVDGQYTWKIIEDSDIARALAAAKAAQDTADGKRRVFVAQPTSESVYDVGDLWANATYSNTYSNDLLRCKTAKTKGTPFSISHWEKASKYTDDTTANKAIADAAAAQQTADNASQVASDATTRLDKWAEDGTISPTEKPALKDEITRIDSDKEEIAAGYSKYELGTPSTYNSVYSTYRAQLVTLTATDPESITIPGDFRTNQIAYYTQRSAALNAIAAAAKEYASNLVDDLEIGGRNLAITSSGTYSDPITSFNGGTNMVVGLSKVITDGLEVGKKITIRVVIKYDNIISASEGRSRVGLQGYADVTGWNDGKFPYSGVYYLNGSGEQEILYSAIVTENMMKNSFWNAEFRFDYVQSGSIQWKEFKVEKGDKATAWTPSPEQVQSNIDGVNSDLQNYKTTVESQFSATNDKITASVTETKEYTDTSIGNIQIGGRNYAKNINQVYLRYGDAFEISDKTDYVRIEKKKDATGTHLVMPLAKKIEQGETYTFSILYRSNCNRFDLNFYDTSKSSNIQQITSNLTSSESWKLSYFTIKANSSDIDAIYTSSTGKNVGDYLEIKYIKLEQGNKATDWTPAPEDVSEQIVSETKAQVEVAKGEITAEVTSTVNNKIDSLQIGGTNLLLGTGRTFEKVYRGYKIYDMSTDAKVGQTYTLSFKYKVNTNTGSNAFQILTKKDEVGVTGFEGQNAYILSEEEGIFKRTFVCISEFNKIGIYSNWDVNYSEWKLEIGDKATDWSLSPEDTEKSISDLSSRVTITEEGIKQAVTITEFNQSKTEILNTAAQDATSKANTAKNEAISTAASDATNKANQAKNNAISTAASDAQAKADAAKNDAIADAAKKYATITTVTQMQTSIDSLGTELSLKASKEELTTVKNELTGNIDSLSQRVTQAEINLKPDNIWIGISSKVDSVVNDIQIGGVNLCIGSATKNFAQYSIGGTFAFSLSSDDSVLSKYIINIKCTASGRGFYSNVAKCVVGETYTWSFYAKCTASKTGIVGHEIGGGQKQITITTEWKKFTHTFVASASQYGSFTWYLGWNTNETLYIHSFKFEKGNKATDWTAAPEDTQIGGRNYFGFNKGIWRNNQNRCTAELDPSINGIIIKTTSTGTTGAILCRWQNIGAPSIGQYTVSFWIKASQECTMGTVNLCDALPDSGNISLTTVYKKIEFTSNVIKYVADGNFNTFIDFESGTSLPSGVTIYVKDLKIEQGNKATDWTPAPEDYSTTEEIKTGITISQNSINVLGKSISLTGAVTFTSLASDAQEKINTAQSTATSASTAASNAQSTANTAKSTADSALSKATTAQTTAETARTEKIELARLGTTVIDGGYLKTDLINVNELFSQNITVSNNATITNLRAVNADISGIVTATKGKIGGFDIDSSGGLTKTSAGGNYEVAIHPEYIRMRREITYAGLPVSAIEFRTGDNADPSIPDEDTGSKCAAYFYRRMNSNVGESNFFLPAIRIISDNVMNNNISMRTEGGAYVARDGMLNKVYGFDISNSNILPIWYGYQIQIYNSGSDANIYFPTRTIIRQIFGYPSTEYIIMRLEISNSPFSNRPVTLRFPTNDPGTFYDQNGNQWGTSVQISVGDTLAVNLACEPSNYWAHKVYQTS